MCIIIHKPAGITLADSLYRICFLGNPDGAGFSYAEGGKITVRKGFFKHDDLMEAMKEHLHRDLVIHYRYATHGEKNTHNCHPWLINGCHKGYGFAVSHNGILDHRSTNEQSDTGCFVEDILAPMLRRDPWFLDQDYCREMLGKFIGSFNKLCIQRSDGVVQYINGDAGVKDLGCWFSNSGYKYEPFKPLDLKAWNAEDIMDQRQWYKKYRDNELHDEFEGPDSLPDMDQDDKGVVTEEDQDWFELMESYQLLTGFQLPVEFDKAQEQIRRHFKLEHPHFEGLADSTIDEEILACGNSWY